MATLISTKTQASSVEPGLVRLATSVEAIVGTNTTLAVTPAGLKGALDALLDGAPAALDTLNELAAAINDDATFFTTINSSLTNLQEQINSLSGGGASNQAEVDRIETAVGLATDGQYVSRSGTNYLDSASSIVGELTALDTQVKANEDAVALRATTSTVSAIDVRLTAAEADIDAEETKSADFETRITSLEGTSSNQAELDATQASAGLNANGTLPSYANNNFYSASASLKAAIEGVDAQAKINDTELADHESRITTLEAGGSISALQSEVDASQAAVGLATNGTYVSRSGTNYIDSASSITAEIGLLDAQVRTNEQDITSIESQITTIVSEGDSSEAAIIALQSELDTTQAGAGLSGAGNYTAPGSSNYLSGASTLKAADSLLDTQIKTNETAIATKASSSSVSTLQSEVDATQVGAGLDADGGYTAISGANFATSGTSIKAALTQLDTQAGTQSSSITALNTLQTAQEAAIGLSTSGTYVSRSSTNFIDSASSVAGEITLLDTQLGTTQSDLDTAEASLSTAEGNITTLTTLANTHEASIGLDADGGYTAISGANHATSGTSLKVAVGQLDTQIAANVSSLATKATAVQLSALDLRVTNAESDIDDLESLQTTQEAAIGLSTSGGYVGRSGTNFLDSASSIVGEITALDTQAKTNADAISSNDSDIGSINSSISTINSNISSNDTEIQALEDLADVIETAVGLNNNGTYSAISGANFATSSVSLKAAVTQLDTQLNTTQSDLDTEEAARASADNTLAASINTVEASVGLDADGGLTISGTNFINGQSTLLAATKVLDTNQNLINDIQGNIKTSVGLETAGTKTNYSSTNIIANANSLKAAIEALDVQVNTNKTDITSISGGSISTLQAEVDAIETAAGLSSSGTYVAHSGSNFMDSASTMKAARESLDTKLKTVADDLDTAEAAIVSNDGDITALQTRATLLEARCGGFFRNDVSSTSAVMDNSPIIRGHSGPFAYNLGQSYLDGFGAGGFGFDFIFYGTSAAQCQDIHFTVASDGDAAFTGHVSGLNI